MTKCGELLRNVDWASTSLGRYEQWPERLKGYAAMVMEMPVPAVIFWGPTQIQIYNDGYSVIMGPRHPRYFGATYAECWPETYLVIYPWMQRVLQGEAVSVERTLFTLTRHGFTEEAYFTFTFSPLRDDSGAIAGILQPVLEVTHEVLAGRRGKTLQLLEESPTVESAVRALACNDEDIALASLHVVGDDGALEPRVAIGIAEPVSIEMRDQAAVVDACDVLAGEHVGTWGEPTRSVYVMPLRTHGVLAVGLSPRLRFDDAYRAFLDAIGRELSTQLEAASVQAERGELQARADAAAAQAEIDRRHLHSVFENAPVAITMLSGPDYRIELANSRMCEIWGRALGDIRGRALFEAFPETVGSGIAEILDEVRRSGERYLGTEVRIGATDHYFNFVYEPLHDESDQVTSIIAVAADVTDSVLARQAAERLTDELRHAQRTKDEFLAMLGHELRNPLAPIFTAIELWRDRAPDPANARLRDVIERQARHLGMLVDDLLDVSRITQGKVELKRDRVNIGQVVGKAVETVSPLVEKLRHRLNVHVDGALDVLGDPARLVQVFANLLTNAAKYTDAGGEIAIDAKRDGNDVVTTVRDTGRGISPDVLPHVFDMFVQGSQGSDRSLGGLGLGLSIVHNLVALHGGTIAAHSDGADRGSTFVVRLPLAPALVEQRRDTLEQEPLVKRERAGRVLVIDDNEDAAIMLAEVLEAIGYACRVAHDGPSALAIARTSTFDVMLVDIGLPAMDGYEVARQMRELPQGDRVRLIAVTGYGQPDDRSRAFAAGFDDHLVKPVDIAALQQVLRHDARHVGARA